jgi:hypothetical protein
MDASDLVDQLFVRIGSEGKLPDLDVFAKIIVQSKKILRVLGGSTLQWGVLKAETNSPLKLELAARQAPKAAYYQQGVSASYLELFSILEAGAGLMPPNIQRAVPYAAALLRCALRTDTKVTFSAPGREPVTPTRRARKHLKEWGTWGAMEFSDYVALEGTIEGATRHDGDKIYLYDTLTSNRVECFVGKDRLPEFFEMLKIGKPRTVLYGRAHYKEGQPRSIKVDRFDLLPSATDHPGLRAVQGVNITGGIDSVQFVRDIRDAE